MEFRINSSVPLISINLQTVTRAIRVWRAWRSDWDVGLAFDGSDESMRLDLTDDKARELDGLLAQRERETSRRIRKWQQSSL
jgi:hypothetical protein